MFLAGVFSVYKNRDRSAPLYIIASDAISRMPVRRRTHTCVVLDKSCALFVTYQAIIHCQDCLNI